MPLRKRDCLVDVPRFLDLLHRVHLSRVLREVEVDETHSSASRGFAEHVAVLRRRAVDAAPRGRLSGGFLYVDIHSPNYTDGEIRGQLLGAASVAAVPIPSLAVWGAMLMALALMAVGWWRMR
jgi:hypothetical protein